jgi:hypothetical protein
MEQGGAPMAVLLKKLGEPAWQAAAERACMALGSRYGDGELTLAAEIIVTTGVKG